MDVLEEAVEKCTDITLDFTDSLAELAQHFGRLGNEKMQFWLKDSAKTIAHYSAEMNKIAQKKPKNWEIEIDSLVSGIFSCAEHLKDLAESFEETGNTFMRDKLTHFTRLIYQATAIAREASEKAKRRKGA